MRPIEWVLESSTLGGLSATERVGREVPLETIDFILDKVLQAARHLYSK